MLVITITTAIVVCKWVLLSLRELATIFGQLDRMLLFRLCRLGVQISGC